MACASCWEFGVYPESGVKRAVAKAKKVALALDQQIPGMCPHEVKEIEVDVEWG